MDFGSIIKRSWTVTWRYKGLWVLGLFAGVSGCQSSGGGGGSWNGGTAAEDFQRGMPDPSRLTDSIGQWLPLILVATAALLMIWFVWTVLSIAARGGLITGVNEIEEGRPAAAGSLWSTGFSRFWSLLGLELLLGLPVFLTAVVMLMGVFIPLFTLIVRDGDLGASALLPICGSLGLGLPLLLVLSFVLGIMRLVAQRYVMLGHQGAATAAGNSWRFLRTRFKDTLLMWLINAGLNFVASLVVAIPAVVIGIATAIPLIAGFRAGNWETMVPIIIVGVLALFALSFIYAAVWGVFTSALWTLFFRSVAGMGQPAIATVAPVGPSDDMPSAEGPVEPVAPQAAPPMADDSPADRAPVMPIPPAPPIEEYPTNPPQPPAPGD